MVGRAFSELGSVSYSVDQGQDALQQSAVRET